MHIGRAIVRILTYKESTITFLPHPKEAIKLAISGQLIYIALENSLRKYARRLVKNRVSIKQLHYKREISY